ncbi:collagen binding domain-containing protein [Micromonospora sp. NPDC050417]|uniref:collagen binding domain-containing protein n=1 Tax=Micromonospora sp. NPDC050417 TaxID=3364280 RepID=UPI0037B9AC3B
MRKSHVRGLGSMVVALLVTTFAAVSPAHAAPAVGSIGGTITDNGSPVAGVPIRVSADGGSYNRSTTTGSDGRYEVPDVPVADSLYRVTINPPGRPLQYAYGQTYSESATLFSVTTGQRTTVDDALLPVGTIRGRFTDPAGNGVLALVRASGDGGASSANTDAAGNYSLTVTPGTYRVGFYAGGTQQYAYGTYDYNQAALFTVAAGQTVTVDDVMLVTGSIAGRLTNADGTPAAFVRVEAQGDLGSDSAGTDQSGNYRIDQLPPGDYKLLFQLPSGARQWAPQVRSGAAARLFTIAGNAVTTHDEQLLPTGSVVGRFTAADGSGMPDVTVSVFDSSAGEYLPGTTAADGGYRIEGVFPGDYQVRFSHWETNLDQYAYGKLSTATADTVTVVANQATTVNDRRLTTGSVRVTARDSVTGATIPDFVAAIGDHGYNSTDGAILIENVPAGTHVISASADDYPYVREAATVTVVAGQRAEVELVLTPIGRITTRIIDRATGAPVANMCVFVVTPKTFAFPDGCGGRSDSTGAVTVRLPAPGAYNLFVLPDPASPYGAQWVGSTGGTGSQNDARRVNVTAGETKVVPKIQLDPRGTITGSVTSATGQPVHGGRVSIVGPDLGSGTSTRISPVAPDGSYRVDWLGPYRWPLLFTATDHAYQWSGGVGNRLNAELVSVPAGGTTDFDYTLKQGTNMVVTVPTESDYGRLVVRNVGSADPVGLVDTDTPGAGIHLRVIGGQQVKVQCDCGPNRWYGGTDLASATPVAIPMKGTVNITFPAI